MEIVDLTVDLGREVHQHGSVGFTAQALIRSDAVAATVLRIAAGGEIGRHPTVVDQLMVVIAGSGSAQGGDGMWQEIRAGQAALWRAGEEHVTRATEDITALAIEMPGMPLK